MNRLILLIIFTSFCGFLTAQTLQMNGSEVDLNVLGCETEDMTLTITCTDCGVGLTPNISGYQWQVFNPIGGVFVPAPATAIDGTMATPVNGTLTISAPNNLDGFMFKCTVTFDNATMADSPVATLKVNANPETVDVAFSGTMPFCESNTNTLSATVGAAKGALSYQWSNGGATGLDNDIPGATNTTYSPVWDDADDGNYNLMVTAEGCVVGTADDSPTPVIVNARPSAVAVNSTSGDFTFCENEDFTLMSGPTPATPSSGTYTYQWTKDGADIGGETAANFMRTAQMSDAGDYRVKVNINGCEALAPTESPAQTVTIVEGVMVTETNFDDEVISGDGTGTATFSADAENVDSSADIAWIFDGTTYQSSAMMTTTFTDVEPTNGNGNTFDLVITNTVNGDRVSSTFEVTDKTPTSSGGGSYDLSVMMTVTNNAECVATTATVSTTSNASVLPIELVSFSGKLVNKNVLLDWITASESNNAFFTIERSFDAKNFETIGEIAGAGTTNERQTYTFTDQQIINNGLTYYRLKQTDFDGAFSYTNIVSIRTSNDDGLVIGQINTAGETMAVSLNSSLEESVEINVFDMSGRLLISTSEMIYVGQNEIELATGALNTGIFVMNVRTKTQNLTQKFVK